MDIVSSALGAITQVLKAFGWFQTKEKKREAVQKDQKSEEDKMDKALKEGNHNDIVSKLD